MKGSVACEYDTETGEAFDVLVVYEYVPYSPPVLTADPYYSEPADGGGCEEMIYKVTGYRQYNVETGDITLDWEKLTPEQSKELTDKLEVMVKNSLKLEDYFHRMCCQDAERAMEPDYD